MTTYHVQLTAVCDVIVEAKSPEDAIDNAVERTPYTSYQYESSVCHGELQGVALDLAHRYFPVHLLEEQLYREVEISPNPDRIYQEIMLRKARGEEVDEIDEDFIEQMDYISAASKSPLKKEDFWKNKTRVCYDQHGEFVGLVGQDEDGKYRIMRK